MCSRTPLHVIEYMSIYICLHIHIHSEIRVFRICHIKISVQQQGPTDSGDYPETNMFAPEHGWLEYIF